MRMLCTGAILLAAAAVTVGQPSAPADPERMLTDRLGFSSADVAQARSGQAIVKMLPSAQREYLGLAGAIRLSGTKERLADWLRNIEHFRNSAQLGTTHVVPMPVAREGFAGVPADDSVRDTLFRYASAYAGGGDVAAGTHDTRALLQQATTLSELAPEFVAYLTEYPKTTLAGVDQLLYWSAMPEPDSMIAVHHLVVYHPAGREVWIADKTIYATRYIDAGVVAIALYDTPGAGGFYAIAGSRVKSSELAGAAAAVLRRRIERTAADTVKIYLEWLRDSLSQPASDVRN